MNRLRTTFWAGYRRWITASVVLLLIVSGGAMAYVGEQHTFGLKSETFTFESGGNELAATLHLPSGDGPHGVVVFVPGDGPADVDAGILPVWESLAKAGYATVQWNKPGVGGSTGNWLDQNMDDRADEVVDVLESLANRDDLDTEERGVIGTSQGGWVIPLVADRVDVDFFVAWSTAIVWQEQGAYLTERQLANAGADPELAARVISADQEHRGDSYQDYLDWYASLDNDVAEFFSEASEDRWNFAERNNDLDANETLPAMRDTPVLLLLGGQDDNVDVDDTERVYRKILDGPCLDVIRYPDAEHNLLDHDGLSLVVTGIFEPRSIFANGLLDDIEHFAARPHDC
jgi:dipeptidyl aminopeptidase/acylaminoacyl peptidase